MAHSKDPLRNVRLVAEAAAENGNPTLLKILDRQEIEEDPPNWTPFLRKNPWLVEWQPPVKVGRVRCQGNLRSGRCDVCKLEHINEAPPGNEGYRTAVVARVSWLGESRTLCGGCLNDLARAAKKVLRKMYVVNDG